MKEQKEKNQSLQQLIDLEQSLQGETFQIQERICAHETRHLAQGWTEGNIRIGWTRKDLFSTHMMTPINSRDRIFSLSSLSSQAFKDAADVENEVVLPTDKLRFYKKSIKAKDKAKRGRPRIRTKIRHQKRRHNKKYRSTDN